MSNSKKIVCCEGCGRDTTSKWGYCTRCIGKTSRTHVSPSGRTHAEWLHFERDVDQCKKNIY